MRASYQLRGVWPAGCAEARLFAHLVAMAGLARFCCAKMIVHQSQAPVHQANDDRQFAVFSTACNYQQAHLSPFVITLRTSGYSGEVVFAIRPETREAKFLRAYNITVEPKLCDETSRRAAALGHVLAPIAETRSGGRPEVAPRFWSASLNLARWQQYARWLRARPHVTHAWLLDVRDVVFQAHPFHDVVGNRRSTTNRAMMPRGIMLFADSWRRHCEPVVSRCIGLGACRRMHNRTMQPNVCAGTVFGEATALARFCDDVAAAVAPMVRMPNARDCHRSDQPLVNHLVWRTLGTRTPRAHNHTRWGHVVVYDHFEGPAVTLNRAVLPFGPSGDARAPICTQVDHLLWGPPPDDEVELGMGPKGPTGSPDEVGAVLLPARHGGAVIPVLHKWAECESTHDIAYLLLCAAHWRVPLVNLTQAQIRDRRCRPVPRVDPRQAVLSKAAAELANRARAQAAAANETIGMTSLSSLQAVLVR